jgi:diacylglycerol O-acyltransferase / wax synthase
MPNPQPKNSFSWGDALFLYIERPGQPLSMACVCIFEGKVALKACRDLVESKLPMIPRYRQHVAFPPFNLGLPSWQFDPKFDIRNHIRQITLRNGTDADLKALASSIVSTHLDRQRPLWDITLVHGLAGKRTGMIARIHHCLADGLAGVGIMNVLMNPSPVVEPIQKSKTESGAPRQRDAGAALLDGLVKSYFSAIKGALRLHSDAVHLAEGLLANSKDPLTDLIEMMPELAAPADRLPFNVVCHGPQKFGWTEIAMDEVRTIRQHCGGTVNDVILTVVAAALRRYSELRRVRVKGRSARILIPVNVRGGDDLSELGNRISFLPVTIPLDIRDPQKLFKLVRERIEYLKRVRAAELVGFAGGLFSAIPTPIWAAIGPVASQLPLSLCNIICTNVPGPQVPLYLLGHKMLSWYPYVPIGGELGFNCAILSYNGKAYFGFTCDAGALPDPENLEKFVDISFAELCRSAKRVKPEAQPSQTAEASQRTKRTRRASRMISLGEPMATPAKPKQQKKTASRAEPVGTESTPPAAVVPKLPVAESSTAVPRANAVGASPAASLSPESAKAAAPALGLVGD